MSEVGTQEKPQQQEREQNSAAPETPKAKTKKPKSSSSTKKPSRPKEEPTDSVEGQADDTAGEVADVGPEGAVNETLNQTLPAGKHEITKDFALQGLPGKDDRMPAEITGKRNMKELEENRSNDEKQSLKIKISLDLDVEVHLSARIKGDITIGLL